jgi:hypothetical protein
VGSYDAAIAIERRLDDDRVVVAINAGDHVFELEVAIDGVMRGWLAPIALPGEAEPRPVVVTDGRATVPIPARTGRLLRVTPDAS